MTKMTEMTMVDLYIALNKVKERLDHLIIIEVEDQSMLADRADRGSELQLQ